MAIANAPFVPILPPVISSRKNPVAHFGYSTHWRSSQGGFVGVLDIRLRDRVLTRCGEGTASVSAAEALESSEVQEESKTSEEVSKAEELAARIAGILPNAKLKKEIGVERMKRSVGVDYGLERTGIAISFCGYAPRPHSVVKLKGDKLIKELMLVAKEEKADEFVVGLPKSWDVQETEQSNKCRTFAGRLAQWAAQKGVRVFLQDEYMTSEDALEFMICRGSTKKSRRLEVDAYAAVILLQTYFDNEGRLAQLMVPKRAEHQKKLCSKYYRRLEQIDVEVDEDDDDFYLDGTSNHSLS